MKYDEWLSTFLKDKKEVACSELDTYAVHTVRRFIDKGNRVWELALTYTGRLVSRSGSIESDGLTISWAEWTTHHDIELPKAK